MRPSTLVSSSGRSACRVPLGPRSRVGRVIDILIGFVIAALIGLTDTQRTGEDASNDFQQEMQQTYAQLAEKVYGTLQSYAEQNGYTVVLDAAASQQQAPIVLWANKSTDITAAVIQAYNAKSGIPAPTSVPSAPAPAPTHSSAPHPPASSAPLTFGQVTRTITARTNRFVFTHEFRGGEVIPTAGPLIAHDGEEEIRTPHDNCLLVMPSLRVSLGHTAVRLARFA